MKIISGVIGMGVGQKHYDAIENYKNSKVKIICEKDKIKLSKLKKKYPNKIITSNENVIFKDKDINLVSIASYDNYHYKQIIKSLKTNKNIIIEKPMCLNLKELRNIKNLLIKKNLKITSNLVLRTNSLFKEIKKKIKLKDIFYIEADYIWGRKFKLFGWRSKLKNYSLILGAAIHMIDLIVWFVKDKPTKVHTFGSNKVTKNSKFKKNSLVVIILEFKNGLIVKISANGVAEHHHFHEIKIFQKNQTIMNSVKGPFEFKKNKITQIKGEYPDKKNRKLLIQNFISTLIDKKTEPLISVEDQFNVMSICLAAEQSLKYDKKVKIKYI